MAPASTGTLRENRAVSYATRLQRLGAWAIELVVVSAFFLIALVLAGRSYFAVFVIALTANWLYFAGLASSGVQATLSGRILGLRVTDLNGEPISFNRATSRYFAMYFTALTPFAIGYLMAFWTKRRQTLHDYVTSTLVLRK
jgi:uncharacterized RDD family membrane protein YckC